MGTSKPRISVSSAQIAAFCQRWNVIEFALFGSVLRDDFTPESDIDVLVEFEEGVRLGYRYFAIQEELAALLGRKVDLLTPDGLSKYFRDEVLHQAQVVYDAA